MTQATATNNSSAFKNVFAILSRPVREVLADIKKDERSENPVVRTIIDRDLGEASYAFSRPEDELAACVLKLRTTDPENAARLLNRTPGVLRAGISLKEFILV